MATLAELVKYANEHGFPTSLSPGGDQPGMVDIPGVGKGYFNYEPNSTEPSAFQLLDNPDGSSTVIGQTGTTTLTPEQRQQQQQSPSFAGGLLEGAKGVAKPLAFAVGAPLLGGALAGAMGGAAAPAWYTAGIADGSIIPAAGGAAGTAGTAVGGGAMDTGAFSDLVSSTAAPAAGGAVGGAAGGMVAPGTAATMGGAFAAPTGGVLSATDPLASLGAGTYGGAAGTGLTPGSLIPMAGDVTGAATASSIPLGNAAMDNYLSNSGVNLANSGGALVPGLGSAAAIPELMSPGGTPTGTPGATPKVPGASTSTGTGTGGSSGSGVNLGSLAGITALLPGLAMGASILKKPNEDTSNLSGIATALQTKAGTEKPDTSALSTLAGDLSGPNSLESLLTSEAKTNIPAMSTGNLPPGAQALVQNALSDAQNSIKSHYASMGLTGSTMEGQELAAANSRAQEMTFNLGQQVTNTGLSEASAASADLNTAANIQNSIIQAGLTASGLSTTDLADSATIYNQIMQEQLAQDASLQAALANFASASAIGVGLASSGKTDTSGVTGLGTTLSSLGSGVSSGWNSFLNSINGGSSTTPYQGADMAVS